MSYPTTLIGRDNSLISSSNQDDTLTPSYADVVYPMSELCVKLYGSIDWPSPKERMAEILRSAGLKVHVGIYSLRVADCSHFVFQEYGDDIAEPCIDADADSVEEMINDAIKVSDALTKAGVHHTFEIYDQDDNLVEMLQHFV